MQLMRIILATCIEPFNEDFLSSLVGQIRNRCQDVGHRVDVVSLPFVFEPSSILGQLTAFRLLDLTESGDKLIAIGCPTHLLRHPSKIILHSEKSKLLAERWDDYVKVHGVSNRLLRRELLQIADDRGCKEAVKHYCISEAAANRLRQVYSGEVTVLDSANLDLDFFESRNSGAKTNRMLNHWIERLVA